MVSAGFTLISIIWGSTWLAIKIGLQSVPPFLGAGIRFVIASSLLFVILKARHLSIPTTRNARRVYLALGLLSFGVPYALVYWAEQYVESGLTSIVFATYPFWVALFSHLFLEHERLNRYKLAGVGAAFTGLLVIFAGDIEIAGGSAFVAMIGILVSTISQAYSLVLIKKHGQPLSPFVMNFVGMSIGAVVLLSLSALLEGSRNVVWDAPAVLSTVYLAVFGSVTAFVAYHWLLKRIEALYLSLTTFINTIVAVVLGAIILGEHLSPRIFAGASCVFLGILIANGQAVLERVRRAM